jgi:nucleoside-diphosphate-sugar epimerase
MAAEVRHSRKDIEQTYHANVEGTRHAVRLAAKQGARLVFISTSGTVGCFPTRGQSADESAPSCEQTVRRWPYYHSKIESERAATALAQELGVELVIVRIPVLLGPDDFGGRSTGHVARFMRGKLPFLVRGGIQIVDVRDVAQALATLTTIESPEPVYHLGGFAGSTAEFFGACSDLVGRPVPPHVPYRVAWGLAAAAEKAAEAVGKHSPLPSPVVVEMAAHWWDVRSTRAASLGFSARALEQTLSDVVRWLEARRS